MIERRLLPLLALLLPPGAATAQNAPLLDYRDEAFLTGSAFYSQQERQRVADALSGTEAGDALGDDFAILGDAEGAFTAASADERVYLVQQSAPVAIDPFPEGAPPILLVMGDETEEQILTLPADVQYQRLVAAADGDGDGRDEVLLETVFTNMGQTITALDVVALSDDGTARPIETLADVHVDSCDNPAGERSLSASVISVGADGFSAKPHELDCPG